MRSKKTLELDGPPCYAAMRRSRLRLPLRIASLSASLRNGAFEHQVHGDRPVERHVGAVDDLPDAHLGDEMPQPLVREHHRVDEDLRLQVLARLLLVGAVGVAPHRRTPLRCVRDRTAGSRRHARAQTRRPGNLSSVPSKISRDRK